MLRHHQWKFIYKTTNDLLFLSYNLWAHQTLTLQGRVLSIQCRRLALVTGSL
jgi:hypothetical protein